MSGGDADGDLQKLFSVHDALEKTEVHCLPTEVRDDIDYAKNIVEQMIQEEI